MRHGVAGRDLAAPDLQHHDGLLRPSGALKRGPEGFGPADRIEKQPNRAGRLVFRVKGDPVRCVTARFRPD